MRAPTPSDTTEQLSTAEIDPPEEPELRLQLLALLRMYVGLTETIKLVPVGGLLA